MSLKSNMKKCCNCGRAQYCPVHKNSSILVAKKEIQKKREVENTEVRRFSNRFPQKNSISSKKKVEY